MLFQQNGNSGNMNERQEGDIEFVIASKYPAKPFEFLKETFNHMALLVGIPIYRPWIAVIALGWNRIRSILRIDVCGYPFASANRKPLRRNGFPQS